MSEIITMGEIIVEIMRDSVDQPLNRAGVFKGPYPSGAPAIFIDTAARLGHSCAIIGGVGDDDFGDCLVDRLSGDGVDCSMIIRSREASTGCAFVTYFSDGERKFIFHIGNTPAVMADVPPREKLEGCRYFHIMGCSVTANIGFGRRIVKTMHEASECGAQISFDPNIRPELMRDSDSKALIDEIIAECAVFMPGVGELLSLTGVNTVEKAVAYCFKTFPKMKIIALKNGKKGSTIYTRDETVTFGIYPVTPLDATGAGDSFDAAFLCGLLEGKSILDSTKLATAAASLNTAAFGPMEGNINRETVSSMIESHSI